MRMTPREVYERFLDAKGTDDLVAMQGVLKKLAEGEREIADELLTIEKDVARVWSGDTADAVVKRCRRLARDHALSADHAAEMGDAVAEQIASFHRARARAQQVEPAADVTPADAVLGGETFGARLGAVQAAETGNIDLLEEWDASASSHESSVPKIYGDLGDEDQDLERLDIALGEASADVADGTVEAGGRGEGESGRARIATDWHGRTDDATSASVAESSQLRGGISDENRPVASVSERAERAFQEGDAARTKAAGVTTPSVPVGSGVGQSGVGGPSANAGSAPGSAPMAVGGAASQGKGDRRQERKRRSLRSSDPADESAPAEPTDADGFVPGDIAARMAGIDDESADASGSTVQHTSVVSVPERGGSPPAGGGAEGGMAPMTAGAGKGPGDADKDHSNKYARPEQLDDGLTRERDGRGNIDIIDDKTGMTVMTGPISDDAAPQKPRKPEKN